MAGSFLMEAALPTPSQLRHSILRHIETHEAGGSSSYAEDKDIAAGLSVELREIQKQLEILEDEEKVKLSKAFGPSYGAALTPRGMKALESVE